MSSGARTSSLIVASACVGVIAGQASADSVAWDGGATGTGSVLAVPGNWAGDVLPQNGDGLVISSANVTATNPTGVVTGVAAGSLYLNNSLTGVGGGVPFTGVPASKVFTSLTFGTEDAATTLLPATSLSVFNGFNSTYVADNNLTFTGDQNGNLLNVGAGVVTPAISLSSGLYGTMTLTLAGTPSASNIRVANAATTLTLNPAIDGNSGFTKTGNGTLYLTSSANSYTGNVAVNAGTLRIASNAALGNAANTVTVNNATLWSDATTFPATRSTVFNGNSTFQLNTGTVTMTGTLGGSGTFTKSGTGTIFINNASNSYTGDFVAAAGTLGFGTSGAIGPGAKTVTINDGAGVTLDSIFTSATYVIGTANFVLNGSASRITTGSSEAWTINGSVSGPGGLTKTGSGSLSLNGTGNYSGATNLNTGTIYANGNLTTSAVNVAASTTLGGIGTINSNVNVGGIVFPGTATLVGTLTVNGNLALTNGTTAGTYRTTVATAGQPDLLAVSGLLDITGGGLTIENLITAGNPAYVIASYGSLNGAAFTTVTGLLGGYTLNYTYNGNQIALVRGNTKLYYTGTTSGDFATATNFTVDAANTTSTAQYATASADVYVDNGKPLTTSAASIAATTYVNSLNFSDSGANAPTGFTIGQAAGAGTLVIRANGINSAAGTGIVVTNGSATNTIATPVSVISSQSWTNNGTGSLAVTGNVALGTNTLTLGGTGSVSVSGVISGSGTLAATGAGTVTVSGANTYLGGTVVNKSNAGVLRLAVAAQTPVITGAGADIRSGALALEYTDASFVATIRALLVASRATGFTDPTAKLRSSLATATRGLGYKDDGTAVIIKATLYGDADLDGGVSINDFNALAGSFGQSTGRVWVDGDFDYDGGVSINDFNLLAGSFGQSLPANSPAWAGLLAFAAAHNDLAAFEAVTGVPEPTSLALLAAGATLGLRRRRVLQLHRPQPLKRS